MIELGEKRNRGRLSGGVAVYVQDSFANHMEVKLQYSNGVVEVLGLFSSLHNLFLTVVYRQPDDITGGHRSTLNELKPALDKIQDVLKDIGEPSPNILICGDFNLPNHSWNNNLSNGNAKTVYDCIDSFMNENFLTQHIANATHKDGNTLDLVLTNNNGLLHSNDCVEPSLVSISDHFIVECKTILEAHIDDTDSELPSKVSPLDNLNFQSNDIDWEKISDPFKAINWITLLSGLTPEEQLNITMEKYASFH